ncbi:hypothetical protein REPUB_Repub08aG0052400 [Reevesia pubescens]
MAGKSPNRAPKLPTQPDQGRGSLDTFWCGVCVSDVGKSEMRGTIDCCNRFFCLACIINWAKQRSYCPICRLPFTTIYGPSKRVVFVSKNLVNGPQPNQAYQLLGNATPRPSYPSEKTKCRVCNGAAHEIQRRLLCDICDSAVHTTCIGFAAGTAVPDAAWFCLDCAFPRSKDPTSGIFNVKLLTENQKSVIPTSGFGNINARENKPVVGGGRQNPSFSSIHNCLTSPFFPSGRKRRAGYEAAAGPSERRSDNLSPHHPLFGKRSSTRVTELENAVQSLQLKMEDERTKSIRLEDQMEQLIEIEKGIQERNEKQIEEKMQQALSTMHSAVSSNSKPPV